MTRSRIVLMAAWGLLAVGSIVQFIRAGGDGETDAMADPPAELADAGDEDPAAGGTGPDDRGDAADGTGDADGDGSAGLSEADAAGGANSSGPATIATVVGDGVVSRTEPGTGDIVHWFPSPTQFGGVRTFLVVDDTSSPDWVKVSLPVMPNGQEGWIPRSAVTLSTVDHRATIDLSDATVTVWEGDEVIASTEAVIGRDATPTPVGRFYVRDIVAQDEPTGAFGPWVLALSGFSETLETFEGGLPGLALHGTDQPAQIGSALSAGCVRVPNEIIEVLAGTVPLGTPVTIVA